MGFGKNALIVPMLTFPCQLMISYSRTLAYVHPLAQQQPKAPIKQRKFEALSHAQSRVIISLETSSCCGLYHANATTMDFEYKEVESEWELRAKIKYR